jgi:predicted dehydrogenase
LVVCADVLHERAQQLAQTVSGAVAAPDWHDVMKRDDVDIVIASTYNGSLAEVTGEALKAGKHVLVEKPGARNVQELEPVIEAAQRTGRKVRVGFNHRYHPAFLKARELFEAGVLGELMFVRGRYGHGGRIGYEKEWRANPALSGGGELIDQGVHLIDLARWFLGDFSEVKAFVHTYFWKMPVEDNAFMLLKTPRNQVAFLHVSCTEWKNLFSFEIYGRQAKLHIEGLGGSYGTERLTYYRMLPEMGPPETTLWEYPVADTSWQIDFEEFLKEIESGRSPSAGLEDALAALTVVGKIYEQSSSVTAYGS